MNSVEKLTELWKAGVNVGMYHTIFRRFCSANKQPQVRMNFSHGSYEYHQSVIDNTRKMVMGMLAIW